MWKNFMAPGAMKKLLPDVLGGAGSELQLQLQSPPPLLLHDPDTWLFGKAMETDGSLRAAASRFLPSAAGVW